MKYMLIPALCMLSCCANKGFDFNRDEKTPVPVKISAMFTGKWVRVKLNNNPKCLNKYLYSRGIVEENRKTMVMTQMSSGFDIVKFQLFYERNGIHFGKTIRYLYLSDLPKLAHKAFAQNQNVIILTVGRIPEIKRLITREFKTNYPSGMVMDHMSAFKLSQKSPDF